MASGKLPDSFPSVSFPNGLTVSRSPSAREAERLANEGKRLIRAGRADKAIEFLKRAVELRADGAAI